MAVPLQVLVLSSQSFNVSPAISELECAGFVVQWKRAGNEPELESQLSRTTNAVLCEDGMLESALKLTHTYPDLPIIVLSREANVAAAVKAIHLGADDYLAWDGSTYNVGHSVTSAISRRREKRKQEHQEARQQTVAGLFRDVIEHSLVGIQILQNGRYAYANRKLAQLFGYTQDEILALDSWTEVVAEVDREKVLDEVRRRVSGETPFAQYVFKGLRKDRTEIDVEVRSDQTELNGQPAVIGTLVDVTERRRAEATLRESEERFRSAFERTHVATVLTDLEHRFIRANAAFAKMFGYSDDEILKLTMADITHPDHLAESYQQRQPLLEGKRDFFQMEKRYLRKDGQVLWGLTNVSLLRAADGKPLLYVGQVQDITEQKLAIHSLQAAEERFRSLIEQSIVGFYIIQDDRLTYVNPRLSEILGYSAEELTSAPLLDFVHEDDRATVAENVRKRLSGEIRSIRYSLRMYHRSGSIVHVDVHGGTVEHDGRPAIIGVVVDVTQAKRLEDQLRQSQKMEAIGRLAGGVAHDFNNLLTVINGYSEIVVDELPRDDTRRALVIEIHRAAQSAASLTRQLLAFSRQQVLKPCRIVVNGLLRDMKNMLGRLIGEDIQLEVVEGADLWPIRVDTGQFEQVVLNLAVNARDAMPQGGKLTIETRNMHLDDTYVAMHCDTRPGDYVMLAVSDSGCGMDKATQTRVFEPFFSTKGEKGTGLGLSTVYGIVRQSEGHIEVYSELGFGTTFRIYLPRDRSITADEKMLESGTDSLRGSETILLVEDEETVRTLARMVLEKQGYTVLEAEDSLKALTLFEKETPPIDLLITDVVMPHMNGRELAECVQTRFPHIDVLFLSGYTDDAIVRHGVLNAQMHFLQKPFTVTGLAQKVRAVLNSRRG